MRLNKLHNQMNKILDKLHSNKKLTWRERYIMECYAKEHNLKCNFILLDDE